MTEKLLLGSALLTKRFCSLSVAEGKVIIKMNKKSKYKRYETYKNSGLEWIGEIPEHWDVKRLKYLSSIKTGEKNTEDKVENGKYPFFVRSQIPEKINSYSFDGEAILIAGDGVGVGKVYHYINGKFDYHQRVYKFSNFKYIDGKLLYYFL